MSYYLKKKNLNIQDEKLAIRNNLAPLSLQNISSLLCFPAWAHD